MSRVAAVDCGTNSLRLLVADVEGDELSDVHREMRVVRLGEGVDRTGRLSAAALERTGSALRDYARLRDRLGAERTRLVATSATRDAANRGEFTALVRDVLGVEPEIVTGEQEAALSFAGATRGLAEGDAPFLVVDIGGGSTEFVLGGREPEAARSVDVGCVRLTERHLSADPPTPDQVAAAERDVDDALALVRATVPLERTRLAIGVAGTVTTVAAHALGLDAYRADVLHRVRLTSSDVVAACTSLLTMTRQERAALPYMHPGRVDVIGAGALVLGRIVQELALPELLVSETDILDGIAWSLG